MKKRLAIMLSMILVFAVFGTACGQKDAEDAAEEAAEEAVEEVEEKADEAELVNPLVETDAQGIMDQLGFEFGVPEGAEDVEYYILDGKIAQMRFEENDTDFTARIKAADDGFEDISGMYYDWTAVSEDETLGYCKAKSMSYVSETEDDVMVMLWYDEAPGIVYSLSAEGDDLNGLDLSVYAEQVYIETQGDN